MSGGSSGISQTMIAGHITSGPIVSGLLMLTIFLLGLEVAMLFNAKDQIRQMDTKIQLLGLQVQDQTAVMLREGIIKPGDLTLGPTNPANKSTEGKRQ